MPFCSRKKRKKPLQVPYADAVLRGYVQSGKRVSLCAFAKGSMTLEASLALPFFLCAVAALLYLFAFTSVQAKESRTLMERAETLAVTTGPSRAADPYIRLYDAKTVSLPFSFFFSKKEAAASRVVVRAWAGYTGESFGERADEELVYITPSGGVYHKNRDCSYLRLSIRQISAGTLEGERNLSGSRYTPCEYCTRGRPGGTVYITDYGTSYHHNINCQGLKRTVMAVPISQTGGRHGCSRCSGR